MGNWYQSDANAIGEHDRAELAFATATLRTQDARSARVQRVSSRLARGPGRSAAARAPTRRNTALALGELAGWGIKGLIDFPLQDTLAPFGWEAPFSNALYAWDAAFALRLDDPSSRVARRPPRCSARSRSTARRSPKRIASRTSRVLYDGRNDAFRAAALLKAALATCRARGIACDAIDPCSGHRRAPARRFATSSFPRGTYRALVARARAAARARGRRSVRGDGASAARRARRCCAGPHGTFVVVENWSDRDVRIRRRARSPTPARRSRRSSSRAREARIVAVDVDLAFSHRATRAATASRRRASFAVPSRPCARFGGRPASPAGDAAAGRARSTRRSAAGTCTGALGRYARVALRARAAPDAAVCGDRPSAPSSSGIPACACRGSRGFAAASLDADAARARTHIAPTCSRTARRTSCCRTTRVVAVVVPDGGARVVVVRAATAAGRRRARGSFTTCSTRPAACATTCCVQPPPSTTDRIAKYTHLYPAGMFNRAYDACTFEERARCRRVPRVRRARRRAERRAVRARRLALGARVRPARRRRALHAARHRLQRNGSCRSRRSRVAARRSDRKPASSPDRSTHAARPSGAGSALRRRHDRSRRRAGSRPGCIAVVVAPGRRRSGVVDTGAKQRDAAARARAGRLAPRHLRAGEARIRGRAAPRSAKRSAPGSPRIRLRRAKTGKWRNGIRSRLKSDRVRAHVGSSPTFPNDRRLGFPARVVPDRRADLGRAGAAHR